MKTKGLIGGFLIVGIFLLMPVGLQHLSFFRVRQVELVGIEFLSPHNVLARADLETDRNIFQSLSEIEGRIAAVPGVVDVRVERRVPGTLRIVVTERAPVAFAPGPDGFVALDGDAQPLPYDPTVSEIDLPVIPRADTILARALATIRAADPELYREVDGARAEPSGGVSLLIGQRRILVPAMTSANAIEAVSAVRRDLDRTGATFTELDARFDGLVVVRGRTT